MSARAGWRLWSGLLASGFALGAPSGGSACTIAKADFDRNGTLDVKLVGKSGRQNAVVELRGSTYLAQIDCNGNGSYGDAVDVTDGGSGPIETFTFALGGADTITVLQAADLAGTAMNLVVPLGGGANRFTFRSQGFALSQRSSLAFDVRGAGGADEVIFDLAGSTLSHSAVLIRADLGNGANASGFVGPTQAFGSLIDVSLIAGGAAGKTTAFFHDGGGRASSSTITAHFVGADGARYADSLSTTLSGKLEDASRFNLYANLQQGNDRYDGHFDVSTFGIDAAGGGGSEALLRVNAAQGFDVLRVDDSAVVGPATVNGLLSVDLQGGPQPDALGIVWNGLTGSGEFRYRADGGVTNDRINGSVSVHPNSANRLLFQFLGHTEMDISAKVADVLNVSFDAPPSVSYGPLSGIVLDGGLQGDDVCDFVGTALHAAVGCERGSR